ncbi:MAG TPA: hypothetical protein VEK11_16135 [Thermoanaerobaculia bacterium]|nr:hypothetical protein [Thermoanaerobaculia bacterium]
MARRITALAGFFAVLALALMLLYRVYMHHRAAEPYDEDEGAVVRVDIPATAPVKIASGLR